MKQRESFIEAQYLDDGKGPACRMIVISPRRLREILTDGADDIHAETFVDDVIGLIEDGCEDLDEISK